jgi:hypothetical protein
MKWRINPDNNIDVSVSTRTVHAGRFNYCQPGSQECVPVLDK